MTIPPASLRLPARLDNLARLTAFASERLEECAPDIAAMALGAKLDLVLEELLVNVISYAYPDAEGDVEIICLACDTEADPFLFCMEIRDQGAPFDPSKRATPDTNASMDDRDIGGLGIHLVREMTSSFSYARDGEDNITRFCLRHP